LNWYALESPKGVLIESTLGDRENVWMNAFDHLSAVIPGFQERYWKRERASKAAAKRLGWRIVKVQIVKIADVPGDPGTPKSGKVARGRYV
jgi:hypothetical protein